MCKIKCTIFSMTYLDITARTKNAVIISVLSRFDVIVANIIYYADAIADAHRNYISRETKSQ